jgi:hypothetical protein
LLITWTIIPANRDKKEEVNLMLDRNLTHPVVVYALCLEDAHVPVSGLLRVSRLGPGRGGQPAGHAATITRSLRPSGPQSLRFSGPQSRSLGLGASSSAHWLTPVPAPRAICREGLREGGEEGKEKSLFKVRYNLNALGKALGKQINDQIAFHFQLFAFL